MEDVLAALRLRCQRLAAPPADEGRVLRVVQRLPDEKRALPPRLALDPEDGAIGDRWGSGSRNPEAMVTLMRADVAALLVADGGIELFGDNLFATIDTSAANLPPGTTLRVGSARCVVTPKPHTGCHKFSRRGVPFARELTALPELKPLQLRGVHLRVLARGSVAPGDPIVVESRP